MAHIAKKKATPRKAAAKKNVVSTPELSAVPPTHQEIALLAYQFWEDHGREHGDNAQDWFQAEKQLEG